MCDFIQTCRKEPTVSIKQIEMTTDPVKRNQLIAKRTAEENRCTGGHYYVFYLSGRLANLNHYDQFQGLLYNLAWEYYSTEEDVDRRPLVEFTVLEFSYVHGATPGTAQTGKHPGIELIGRLHIGAYIEKIERHDPANDIHKAINRIGCFNLKLKIVSLSHTDLRPEDCKSEVTKNMSPYYQTIFQRGATFEIVWSAKRAAGRFTGMNLLNFVPDLLAPYDGVLPSAEAAACHRANRNLYIGTLGHDGLYIIGGGYSPKQEVSPERTEQVEQAEQEVQT